MPVLAKGTRTRVGGGGGKSRHNTRRSELERLADRVIRRLAGGDAPAELTALDGQVDEGPRFWTRNLPEWVMEADADTDPLAAHAWDWESDVALAEGRLEREVKRGTLEALDGGAVAIRSTRERALAALGPPRAAEALAKEEREIILFRGYMEMRDHEESNTLRRGRGRPVTGYEMVFSFDLPVTNDDIRLLTDAFLDTPMRVVFNKKRGPELVDNPLRDLPAGGATHPEGTLVKHTHLLFANRDASGRAVQIRPQVWRSFDVHWATVWSEFVRDPELFRDHVRKKEETEAWKRDARERAERGLPPAPKPERVADLHDQKALKLRSQIRTDLKTVGLDPEKFRIVERPVARRANDPVRRLAAGLELAEERFVHALATASPLVEVRRLGDEMDRLAGEAVRAREARAAAGKRDMPAPLHTDREAEELTRLRAERTEAALDDTKAALLVGDYDYIKAQAEASRGRARRAGAEARDADVQAERDERRHRLVMRAVEEARESRSDRDMKMPGPRYWVEVYNALDELGHSEREAKVARRLRESCRAYRLAPERVRETAEVELGRELVARMYMLAAAAAWEAAVRESEAGRNRSEEERATLRAAAKGSEQEYVRARLYREERRVGASECLVKMGAGDGEVAPRLTAEEVTELRDFASRMGKGEERDEFLTALAKAEEARRGRERLEQLRSREPMPDGEVVRLSAGAELARHRAGAARRALNRHERTGEFYEWHVKDGDKVEGWSLALAVNRLEADGRNRRLRGIVGLVRDAVEKRTVALRDEAEASEREARSLDETLGEALEVREAHGLGCPEPEFTPAQEREIENHVMASRDVDELAEFCQLEFGRDQERAAGRSLAREIVLTLGAHADAAEHEEYDRELAEVMGALPRRDPLAAKIKVYLECRREEQLSAAEFLKIAHEVAAGQSEQCLALTGRAPRAVFTREEYEVVAGSLAKVADDREHDRLVRESNRALVVGEGGRPEQAEQLSFRKFNVREDDSRARAGLLMGEYLYRKAVYLELYETKQPYSEAMREADAAQKEMAGAVARHRKDYGTEPVAVLSAEQADRIADVTGRYFSYSTVTLRNEAERALVVGRSRGDLTPEVPMQTIMPHSTPGSEQHRADPSLSHEPTTYDINDSGGRSR